MMTWRALASVSDPLPEFKITKTNREKELNAVEFITRRT